MDTTMKSLLAITIFALTLTIGCTPKAPPTTPPPPSFTDTPLVIDTLTPTPTQMLEPVPTVETSSGISKLYMFLDGGWGVDEIGGFLFRTIDGGITWTQISLPDGLQGNPGAGAFLDANTAWIPQDQAITSVPVLLHTTDGGQNWEPIQVAGLENLPMPSFLKFINPTQGWVEQYEGGAGNLYIQVLGTQDGGASFQVVPIIPPEPDPNLPEGLLHLCNICSDAFYYDPSRIMIVEGDLGSMQSRGSVHALTSFDLGSTWNQLSLPLPPAYQDALVRPLEVVFVDQNDGFLPVLLEKFASAGGAEYRVLALFTTRDGGVSWQLAPGLLENSPTFPAMQFVSSQDMIALCDSALCVTHDGAQTWQDLPLDQSMAPTETRIVKQLEFIDALTGWIVIRETMTDSTSDRIYKTVDGGGSWSPQ